MARTIRSAKGEWAVRVASPKKFDRRSIRTVVSSPKKGVHVITGCPKGHYHPNRPKRKRCDVGLKPQAYRFKKTKNTKRDVQSFIDRHL